jgi:hypothetical protein
MPDGGSRSAALKLSHATRRMLANRVRAGALTPDERRNLLIPVVSAQIISQTEM